MIDQLHIQEFMHFFTGSIHNYGEYTYPENIAPGKVPGEARTVKNTYITIDNYRAHLEGRKGLGIIPINETTGKCKFAVIDIDLYDVNFNRYIDAIEKNNFPIVPFLSKSGGLHLYVFFKTEVLSELAQNILKQFSFLLSIDHLVKEKNNSKVEIFPKQKSLAKGQIGNWINIPYYNAEKAKNCAIKNKKGLCLSEAINYIKDKQITLEEAEKFINDLSFNDAPPCLQLMDILNPFSKDSGRNNYLFSFGVYFKKKDETFFEQNLKELNDKLESPLSDKELDSTIIQSLKKKDYLYKCKENPLCEFCNKKICKERTFGIGKEGGYFSIVETGKIYQYKGSQPYYEMELKLQSQENFIRVRFKNEDELMKQDAFLRLCIRELHVLPNRVKQNEWSLKVNSALSDIEVIEVNNKDDISEITMLKDLITEYLTTRIKAETKDQILAKRVYYDKDTKDYIFKARDLAEFVFTQKGFKYIKPSELNGFLSDWGCVFKGIKTENRISVRVAIFNHSKLDLI